MLVIAGNNQTAFVHRKRVEMGIQPKIGITGLPRSGKSVVLHKIVDMIIEERREELRSKGYKNSF